MIKTLVIHPTDESTDFLSVIYSKIKNCTVIRNGEKSQINKLIMIHDRIIMMGHGTPHGLLSVGSFKTNTGYIVDSVNVSLLKNKECIYIWCNANMFVERHQLKGFYSGMFISEVNEAYYCGVENVNQIMVTLSNNFFASLLKKCIEKDLHSIYIFMRKYYGKIGDENKVAFYNQQRLYLQK